MSVPKKYLNIIDEKFYNTWINMRQRCYNKNRAWYDNYWWRWIYVCDRWWWFDNFFEDMFKSYKLHINKFWSKNTTIERVNNDVWYSNKNCKRATRLEQRHNMRKQHNFRKKCYIFIDYKWKNMSLKDLSKEINIDYKTLFARYKKWWRWKKLLQKKLNQKYNLPNIN